jgi:MFS family permease
MKKPTYFVAASVGNLFEHYDKFLFAFLAPFLAPLFFKSETPLLSLILTFGIMPLGILSRPLGALVFGKMGDTQGRKKALTITLMGMALVTFFMGFLPTYSQAGWIAPLLLALARLMQNFFAAGEVTGGALLILEHCNPKKRSLLSSIYDCSCVLGILIASLSVTLLAQFGLIEKGWRYLYFAGASTALVGLGLRLFIREDFIIRKKAASTLPLIWQQKRLFFTLCLGMGFSYAIYESATTLLNGYLPFVSQISQTDSVWIGTSILVLDLLLLPVFGYLAMRISYQKTISFFLILTAAMSFPLFHALSHAGGMTVIIVRVIFVILGVGFSAPLYAWAMELVPKEFRYTLISLATAVGSQLFGGGACALSLWLYQITGWVGAPGLYLGTLSLLTFFAVQRILPTHCIQTIHPKLIDQSYERC